MKIGFTGTSSLGVITLERLKSLQDFICQYTPTEFHHGDCIGADFEAHNVARQIRLQFFPNLKIHIHPPIKDVKRAFCKDGDVMWPARSYLDRNRDIVNASDILIAMPKDPDREELRSGTWSTWRYAGFLNKPRVFA